MPETKRAGRTRVVLTTIFAIGILGPSMYGFVYKFIEFINTFRGETEGAFAITPMTNYLLASAGFICLVAWAAFNGMFRDMEKPKYTMLDTEEKLNQSSR